MEKHTMDIIRFIKNVDRPCFYLLREYLASENGSNEDAYTESELNTILKNAYVDYISTCDNPSNEIRRLLDYINSSGCHSLAWYIVMSLDMVRVRDDNGNYINGFDERYDSKKIGG